MQLNRILAHGFYKEKLNRAKDLSEQHNEDYTSKVMRELCKTDLFFLMVYVCNRKDIDRDWLYDRCKEIQEMPDGYLDLWGREMYKSTLITFGKTIQDILIDPEVTIGIFSFKVGASIDFLKQIKREFEENKLLRSLFSEIFYDDPKHQSPRWNEDGLIVKRKTNPKEATIEANGVIESMPTGKHYRICVYDDVCTEKTVTTPEMLKRTSEQFELSLNLSSEGGKRRIIGTRYHYSDLYGTLLERRTATPRIYPATDSGKVDGKPVLWTQEYYDERRKSMSPYLFSCQILQNPKADGAISFQRDWLQFFGNFNMRRLNVYIIVDPANTKKKRSDYTAIMVVGYGSDDNFYILDMIRDRLTLTEKAQTLMRLHRQYKPLKVGYEEYGVQADIEHIKYIQSQETYNFHITPLGGKVSKEDRITKLMPLFEQHRIFLPDRCQKTNYEGMTIDLTQAFINEEFLAFPFGGHDDMLDCLSRILDDDLSVRSPGDSSSRSNKTMVANMEYDPFRS